MITILFCFQLHKLLVEWLEDIEQKAQPEGSLLNELSEKKAKLEKFKAIQRDIDSHQEMVKKIELRLAEDDTMQCDEINDTMKKYADIKKNVETTITVSYIIIMIVHIIE